MLARNPATDAGTKHVMNVVMIMENYHQSDDVLDHNAKIELQQSNHNTDELNSGIIYYDILKCHNINYMFHKNNDTINIVVFDHSD